MKKNRKKGILFIVMIVLLFSCACCAFPIPVACGAPGSTCRTGPGQDGRSSIRYDLEPAALAVVEAIFGVDIPLRYYSWDSNE